LRGVVDGLGYDFGAKSGVAREHTDPRRAGAVLGYLLLAPVVASAVLATLIPSYLEHYRALRRALFRGQPAPSFWSDGAAVLPMIGAFAALMLAGFGVVADRHHCVVGKITF
jgi:hypothetical protein